MSTDGEGGIAGCRVLAPAGLDELDLVRVQAAYAAPASSCLAGLAGMLAARISTAIAPLTRADGRCRAGPGSGGRRPPRPAPSLSARPRRGQRASRLPLAVTGRPVTQRPGQLAAPQRCVERVNDPHGMGGPDGPWNSAVRNAGISRGTHAATTAAQPRGPSSSPPPPAGPGSKLSQTALIVARGWSAFTVKASQGRGTDVVPGTGASSGKGWPSNG
jgi:hypothetical protein